MSDDVLKGSVLSAEDFAFQESIRATIAQHKEIAAQKAPDCKDDPEFILISMAASLVVAVDEIRECHKTIMALRNQITSGLVRAVPATKPIPFKPSGERAVDDPQS